MYRIYPGKANYTETAEAAAGRLREQLGEIGRSVGVGQGGRRRTE